MKLKTSEKMLTAQVLELLARLGWSAAHFHDSRRQVRPGVFVGDKAAVGFPDILAIRGPRMVVLELKTEEGRTRPEQDVWLEGLRFFAGRVAEAALWMAEPAPRVDVRIVRPSDIDELASLLR